MVEYDKTQKSAITQEPTPDELAAQPYDLDTNFTPDQKVEIIQIFSYEKELSQISRASIINIDLDLNSEKEISNSPSEAEIKFNVMDCVDKSRSKILQETIERIKI